MDTHVKKAAKAAGTLCAAAGVISVAISGAALAITLKSLKYVKNAFGKIMDDVPLKDGSNTETENETLETVIAETKNIEAENDSIEITDENQKNKD